MEISTGARITGITLGMYTLASIYKNVFVSEGTVDSLLDQFQTLETNLKLKNGTYDSYYSNADTFSTGIYLLVKLMWRGFSIEDGILTQNGYINEITKEISTEKSVLDGKNCIRITFTDRFYEVRPLSETKYLSIVRNFQNKVLDIHILSRRDYK